MPTSKPKPSATKPGLEVKPVNDLEPDEAQSEDVRGGMAGAGWRFGPGGMLIPPRPSDAVLKSRVAPLKGALAKLRELRL